MWGLSLKNKQCVHYWIIESPDGPTSEGVCKKCGAVAEFFNDLQGRSNKNESSIEGDNNETTIVIDADDLAIHV